MPSTMAYRQDDIVLVSFPFTDLTSTKRRPALRTLRGFFSQGRMESPEGLPV